MTNITVEKMDFSEIGENFFALFQDVFGGYDPDQRPQTIYVGYRGDRMVGFMSGYPTDCKTFYIQYAGVCEEFQTTGAAARWMSKFIGLIHDEFKVITVKVWNGFTAAIRLLLVHGFIIVGGRMNNQHEYLVEMARVKDMGVH